MAAAVEGRGARAEERVLRSLRSHQDDSVLCAQRDDRVLGAQRNDRVFIGDLSVCALDPCPCRSLARVP